MAPDDLWLRPLGPDDWEAWRRLWRGYLAFYGTAVGEEVEETTFARLLGDDPNDFAAIIGGRGDLPLGLTHYLFHRHCWRIENVVYLQDLFVAEEARGTGLGRALIEAVYKAADDANCPTVYWLTQEDNAVGRRLYDRVANKTDFIKYQR